LQVYYGDIDGNGTVEVMDAYFDKGLNKVVPWRDLDTVSMALPFVRANFPTFRAYGEAGLAEILGEKLKAFNELQAVTLDSMVFFNRGGKFEAKALPAEAQFAPAFGVAVGDFDGDGNKDVFLSQNFFDVESETARYDGGRGLWLRGDGHGGLQPVPGQESGVAVYGEQRGCALSDFDGDGRVDLAVAQNGAATRLYLNKGAKPGLRVRLKGPDGNPQGFGSLVRLKFGGRLGPGREIHAGSGYWSQDSAVQVMGTPEPPTEISIRWPGGKTITTPIPSGAGEITVDSAGRLEVRR
jgi:enediyne biosynthesis protein E4